MPEQNGTTEVVDLWDWVGSVIQLWRPSDNGRSLELVNGGRLGEGKPATLQKEGETITALAASSHHSDPVDRVW